MNSKQRVIRTIKHRRVDRAPVDFSATEGVIRKLYSYYKTDNYDCLLEHLGIDFRRVEPDYRGPKIRKYEDGSFEDIWGCRRKKICGITGDYDAIVNYPLNEAKTAEEIRNYRWPDPEWFDYSRIPEKCKKYDKFAIIGGFFSSYQIATHLRDMEHVALDMVLQPSLAEALFSELAAFYLEFSRRKLDAADGMIDIYLIVDDFGAQDGLLFSSNHIKKFMFHNLAQAVHLGKKYGCNIMFHSCGSVRKLIPDLIDLGIDILDPVQVSAAGMSLEGLKRDFGVKLCFHGGIDTQELLPYGTPEEVKREVKRLVRIFSRDGGYIVAPSQDFQDDVPVENILALYAAVNQ